MMLCIQQDKTLQFISKYQTKRHKISKGKGQKLSHQATYNMNDNTLIGNSCK